MVKVFKIMLVCMVIFFCTEIEAIAQQTPKQGAKPAMGRGKMGMGGPRGVSSPVVASDNKVTFRISAPKATTVTVNTTSKLVASEAPQNGGSRHQLLLS